MGSGRSDPGTCPPPEYSVLRSRPGQLIRYSDSLHAEQSGDRIPVGGARFSAPMQAGPGADPASCAMDTGCLSPGVKRPGRGVDHPPLSG